LAVVLLLASAAFVAVQSKSLQYIAYRQSIRRSEATWKIITGKDEEFSVLVPGEPSVYFNLVTSNFSKRRLERIYSSYYLGSVYLVVSYDEGSLKDANDNFKAHHLYRGDMIFEHDITLDGYNGKQYRLKLT
jgi:hypothetical protein